MPHPFVGRDELVAVMAERLVSGDSLALSAEGMPGVGKTTMAVALAHHQAILDHFEDGVLWAGLGVKPDVMSALATWAEALGKDVSSEIDPAKRALAVKSAVAQRSLLLVVDDAWQIEPAQLLRCGGPNCCHLLTTRNEAIARAFAGAAEVDSVPELEEEPAFRLLQELAPEACAADPAAAHKLVSAVGGLPLVLELLGGYLAAPERSYFPELSTAAFMEMADPRRRLELAEQRLGTHQSEIVTLQETIALSLEGIPEPAVEAFYALGAFAPKPESFDRAAAEAVTGADAATLALLIARNLLERTESGQLSLHQTLSDVARTRTDEEAAERHRDYYLGLVNADREYWRQIEAAYGQIKWAWAAAPDDERLLDFIWALRIYQERRGLRRDQIDWIERGLRIAEAQGLRSYLAVLLNNIGRVYNSLGQRQKALEYYEQALPIQEEAGDRAGLAATLNNIGSVYNSLGQRQKALEYYEQVRLIAEEVGDRYGLAVTLSNIGHVYDNLGQRQKALEYYEQARPIREEVGDRAGEAVTRFNIAIVYRQEGRLAEAVVQLRRVVELDELVQSPDLEQDRAILAQLEAELAAQSQ
jgi:tetratricopeptide (TPR) repeat protein